MMTFAKNTAPPHIVQGRLTLESGNPIPTADLTLKTTLYFTPFGGNAIRLYNGRNWRYYEFDELSVPLSGLLRNTPYSVYARLNGDKVALEIDRGADGFGWVTSVTSPLRPSAITSISNANPPVVTIAGASHPLVIGDLVLITGNSVGVNNALWRVGTTTGTTFQLKTLPNANPGLPGSVGNGGFFQGDDHFIAPPAGAFSYLPGNIAYKTNDPRWLLLGAIRMHDSDGQTQDITTSRLIANLYNRVPRHIMYVHPGAFPYTVGASWRVCDDNFANRIEFLTLDEALVFLEFTLRASAGTHTHSIGENSKTVNSPNVTLFAGSSSTTSGDQANAGANYHTRPGAGHFTFYAMEIGTGSGRAGRIYGYIEG